MKKLFLATALLASSHAFAGLDDHLNIGARACSEWTLGAATEQETLISWLEGYAAGASKNNDLVTSDYQGFVIHVFQYCERNLDAQIRKAAEAVEGVLK